MKFAKKVLVVLLLLVTLSSCQMKEEGNDKLKVYWFIPDGMRADPDLFDIYSWAEEGELPNIKKMMEKGSYGYSIPVFPGHTPVNFAALLTGSYPSTNGVADGPMHVENRSLSSVSLSGFSSVARKVEPIWLTAEKQGAEVVLVSLPGSTPPELEKGITIRGRWGGWGADFPALNFETKGNLSQRIIQGRSSRLFFLGAELTRYTDPVSPADWKVTPASFSDPKELQLEGWGPVIYGYIYDSTDDGIINYDTIRFSTDKQKISASLSEGEWSDWIMHELNWQDITLESQIRIKVIKLDDDGFFRIRLLYDGLNEYAVEPSFVAEDLSTGLGPMVDFVDNFPPQLIYYDPEDKTTFLEEMDMSFRWHSEAIPFILKEYNPDIVIHDIYSPNQMLTSKWWMGYIDPESDRYDEITEIQRAILWEETKDMYKQLDDMVGKILENSDENTIIILSSDHGAIPINKYVHLNNLFASKGWLRFSIDEKTGEPIIDWENSTVIYLKMDNVYINPDGLNGDWKRAEGEAYEELRVEVKKAILELQDPLTGAKPAREVIEWENVREFLDLPEDRVGDLVVANHAGYGWSEEMHEDMEIFSIPLVSGYKQAVISEDTKGMWTPFIIMGPGIKENYRLNDTISHIDQYPTIMQVSGYDVPDWIDGKVINEILT